MRVAQPQETALVACVTRFGFPAEPDGALGLVAELTLTVDAQAASAA
jgi:hypothetical protein